MVQRLNSLGGAYNPYAPSTLGQKLYRAGTGYGDIRATGALGGKDSDYGAPGYTAPTFKPTIGAMPSWIAPPEQPLRAGPTNARAGVMNSYGLSPRQAMGLTYASQASTLPSATGATNPNYTPDITVNTASRPASSNTGVKSTVAGSTDTNSPAADIPVRQAGDVAVQSSPDVISAILNSMLSGNDTAPDYAAQVAAGLQQFADYASKREAALRAQAEQEGKQMDPATLAQIQQIKDAVAEKQDQIKNLMDSRGLLDSTYAVRELGKAVKGGSDAEAQLRATRLGALQNRLRSALDQLWGGQLGYAEDYANAKMKGWESGQSSKKDLVNRLIQANQDAQDNARADAAVTGYYNGQPTMAREQYTNSRADALRKAAEGSSGSASAKTNIAEEVTGLYNLVRNGVVKSIDEGDTMIDQALRTGNTDQATADYLKRYLRSLGLPTGGSYQPNPDTYLAR